jgi:hypothetical protein
MAMQLLRETYLRMGKPDLAEAQFKQGKLQDAANTLNVLRARAFPSYPNVGKIEASDVSLDFILDERARELIGEENRRMTLMRTKTLVSRVNRLNANSAVNPVKGLSNTHLLLPILLTEIQLNKDAVLQQKSLASKLGKEVQSLKRPTIGGYSLTFLCTSLT